MKFETFAKLIVAFLDYGTVCVAGLVVFSGFMVLSWSDFRVGGYLFFMFSCICAFAIVLIGHVLAEDLRKAIKEVFKNEKKV